MIRIKQLPEFVVLFPLRLSIEEGSSPLCTYSVPAVIHNHCQHAGWVSLTIFAQVDHRLDHGVRFCSLSVGSRPPSYLPMCVLHLLVAKCCCIFKKWWMEWELWKAGRTFIYLWMISASLSAQIVYRPKPDCCICSLSTGSRFHHPFTKEWPQ